MQKEADHQICSVRSAQPRRSGSQRIRSGSQCSHRYATEFRQAMYSCMVRSTQRRILAKSTLAKEKTTTRTLDEQLSREAPAASRQLLGQLFALAENEKCVN